jgi:U3 small nucleolar RNA-associated protein 7
MQKYSRSGGEKVQGLKPKHKALKKTLEELNATITKSAARNADAELLYQQEAGFIEPDAGEKVYKLKQADIKRGVDLNSGANIFDFQLTKFGPYCVNFSRNGRSLLFGGGRGHVATLDCQRVAVGAELQLQEEVRDVCFLQNETLFAVAQRQYT